jgi:hypothetical protein
MAQRKPLSDARKKAIDEADSILERAFQEAATKVRSARAGDDNGDDNGNGGVSTSNHCLICTCGGFVQATGITPHSLKCQREGCGHSYANHDVF